MKKFLSCVALICLSAGIAFSQTDPTLDEYKKSIKSFSDDLAAVLPINSTIGLNWNDAYIGQFLDTPPHFGIGLGTGFTTVPSGPLKSVLNGINPGSADNIPSLVNSMGIPIPAAVVEARIGGFVLPFDIGLKVGFINFDAGDDVKADYFLIGGDVRYCVLEQKIAIPKISIGIGYNYAKSNITLGGVLNDTVIDTSAYSTTPGLSGVNNITVTAPDFYLEWETKVIDLKAQASWNFLILEPSIGLGASYGMSRVSAGAESHVYMDDGTTTDISDSAISALKGLGYDVDGAGVGYTKNVNSMSYRIFGGLGVKILLVRLDLGLMYGLNAKSWGASLGARVQL
jgi:hypothetical protein